MRVSTKKEEITGESQYEIGKEEYKKDTRDMGISLLTLGKNLRFGEELIYRGLWTSDQRYNMTTSRGISVKQGNQDLIFRVSETQNRGKGL